MSEITGLTTEKVGEIELFISAAHRFGTDAFLLADFAAPRHKDTAADLCSGCGIVAAVMYGRFRPKSIETVEIAKEAHKLLSMTIEKSKLKNFKAVCCDLKNWKAEKEVDVITCNPPYKRSGAGIKSSEPAAAVARHEVECGFDDVCAAAVRSLKYGGRLCVCNRPERLCDMMCSMREYGLEPKRVRFVSKNSDSEPWLVLVEGRKGGSSFLRVEKNFYTQKADGSVSEELRSVYLP